MEEKILDELIKNIEHLMDNKIWVTKKTRMESEKNLVNKNLILNYTLIYYSGCLAVMSYLTIASVGKLDITAVSGVIAVLLPSVNIFQYKADYSRRASSYKECYLKLEKLEGRCKVLLSEIRNRKIDTDRALESEKQIYREYEEILSMCENHSDYDYFTFRKTQIEKRGNKNFSISVKEQNTYFFIRTLSVIGMLIVILIPFLFILVKIMS